MNFFGDSNTDLFLKVVPSGNGRGILPISGPIHPGVQVEQGLADCPLQESFKNSM